MLIAFGADCLSKDAQVVNSLGRQRCCLLREQPVLTSQYKRFGVPRFGVLFISPYRAQRTDGRRCCYSAVVLDDADILAT